MKRPSNRATLLRGLWVIGVLAVIAAAALQLPRLTASAPPLRAAGTFFSMFLLGFVPGLWATLVFRERSGFRYWHPLLFLPSFACWSVLSEHMGPRGSLTNAFAEPLYLGVVASSLEIARLLFPRRSSHRTLLLLCSAGMALLAALSFVFFFPDLPE
jgi:hypothetical protein